MKRLSKEDLDKIKKDGLDKKKKNWIKVGYSTCGIAAGAETVYQALVEESQKRNLDLKIKKCGCIGMCYAEPLIEVNVDDVPRVFYGKVDRDTAIKIIDKHVCGKILLNDRIYLTKVDQRS